MMHTKRTIMALAALLVLAGTVSAHDKGDLMLNFEPQFGLAVVPLSSKYGIDYGIRSTVHYYFTDNFAFNVGAGVGSSFIWFRDSSNENTVPPQWLYFPIVGWIVYGIGALAASSEGYYLAPYFTVPAGFRFSFGILTIGAGATVNVPLRGKDVGELINGGVYKDAKLEHLFNWGWYADIGIDTSGIKGKRSGYGVLIRFAGAFGETYRIDPPIDSDTSRNSVFSVSLVLQPTFQLANIPIGGKKKDKDSE